MKVILAETAGFCMGVRRAINLVNTVLEKNNENGKIYTYGQLIHNPQVIEMLEEKGVYAINELTGIKNGSIIVRTHGIAPKVREELKKTDLTLCDATCPRVAKVQSVIKKHCNEGYHTIIVGDRGHSEVIGLLGFAATSGHVISKFEDIEKLPANLDKVCVVSQTTQDKKFFEEVSNILKNK
jgi:4-hydroxy-3-methylbut-2-enyl diphosphate reductase